jgi:hypothetical protein
LTRHLVRTARSPRRGSARVTGTGSRLGGPIPAQQVLGTAGLAEVAGGCSRRPERQRLARQPLGEAAHAGRSVAAMAAGTGHQDLSAQVTEGLAVAGQYRCPSHLLVPPGGRCGGFWSRW